MPDRVKQFIDECEFTVPDSRFIRSISNVYDIASWQSVGKGLRIIKKDKASEVYSGMMSDIRRERIGKVSPSFYINMDINLATLAHHSTLVKYIREN
jgi:hypothetical protein